eukprot:gene3405-13449_t
MMMNQQGVTLSPRTQEPLSSPRIPGGVAVAESPRCTAPLQLSPSPSFGRPGEDGMHTTEAHETRLELAALDSKGETSVSDALLLKMR